MELHFTQKSMQRLLALLLCIFSLQFMSAQGTIEGFVWEDENSNGIQDAGEPGIEDVFVILYTTDEEPAGYLDLTDSNGNYSIEAPAGTYLLKFANPGGFIPSPMDIGDNDDVDSDQFVLDGFTEEFELANGQTLDFDGGYREPPSSCPTPITATLDEVICNGDGTFSFVVTITGGGPWGWNVTDDEEVMGDYGVPFTFGPYDVADGNVTFQVEDMDNGTCTDLISVTPDCAPEAVPCDPLTNPGSIAEDQEDCGSFNPSVITSEEDPSGGEGDMEYIWLCAPGECPTSIFQRVYGADGPTYDPPTVYQTTYYTRWARRAGCTDFINGKTNCVEMLVETQAGCDATDVCETSNICQTRLASSTNDCGNNSIKFGIYADNLIGNWSNDSDYYHLLNGELSELTNGTAKLRGRLINKNDPNLVFDMDLTFMNRSSAGTPVSGDCYDVDAETWYYYNGVTGELHGQLGLQGAVVAVTLSDGQVQIGMGAGLNENDEYGISFDMDYSVVQQPMTNLSVRRDREVKFRANLTGGAAACVADATGCDNNSVLYLHGPSSQPNMFDQIIISHLQSDGYQVTSQMSGLATPQSVAEYGLIVISASVNPVQINPGLANTTTPIITWEPYIYATLGMTGPDNQVCFGLMSGTQIDIECSTHPLTSGCGGLTEVYDITRSLSWGMPTDDATVVATIPGNPGKGAIFGYEVGDNMHDGFDAPARRVGFYLGLQSANHLTEKGFDLLSAAAAWAIDCRDNSPAALPVNGFVVDETPITTAPMSVYPNPATDVMYINMGQEMDIERTLSIVDNTGRIVKTQTITANAAAVQTVYVNDLPRGVYYLQLTQEGVAPQTQRFVVVQ